MKKLLIVLLVLLLSLDVYAQNNQTPAVFREISELPMEVLSSRQQFRLKQLKKVDNYRSVSLVKMENIKEYLRKESLTFDLPQRFGKLTIKTKSIDYSTKENFVWKGTIKKGEATLIQENGRTYGQIRYDGAVYDIQYMENNYAALVEYDMSKLNKMGCAATHKEETKDTSSKSSKGSSAKIATGSANPNPLVRALVLFTPAAAETGMNMTDLANMARAQWLTAQLNSNVVSTLQIAGVEPFDFDENGDPDSDTDDGVRNIWIDVGIFRNNVNAQQLRNQFEADVVILLTNGFYPGVGGIVADIGPREDDAYAIVQVANATSTITLVHEAAHLFGARHEFAEDNSPGVAHGHDWETGWWKWKKKYGSIMRTQEKERNRVLHFSNPDITHNGKATGVTGTSFNTRVINLNGQAVCDFRFTQPNLTASIFGPGSANDGDALSFSGSAGNGQAPYTYRWEVNTGGGYYIASSASTLNYAMPVGKDLEVSLTITDANGQQATDYQFVMNLFFGGGPCTACPDITLEGLDFNPATQNQTRLAKLISFPNPTSNALKVILPKQLKGNVKLQIMDLNGVVIEETVTKGSGQLHSMDIAGLREGIYILKVMSDDTVQSIRFIKE